MGGWTGEISREAFPPKSPEATGGGERLSWERDLLRVETETDTGAGVRTIQMRGRGGSFTGVPTYLVLGDPSPYLRPTGVILRGHR